MRKGPKDPYLHSLMCADVPLMYWFLVLVLNGGYPLGVATGVKGVYCFWWVVVSNKPHKIEISHFQKCMPDKKNDILIALPWVVALNLSKIGWEVCLKT